MARPTRTTRWTAIPKRLLAPLALCAILFTVSASTFTLAYRNDLLTYCAEKHQATAVSFLVALGARATDDGVVYSEPALVEYLHSLVGEPPPPRQTPEITLALLRAGASASDHTEGGWTPLMISAASGQIAITKALVSAGADIEAAGIGEEQLQGLTPLMAAAMHGQTETVDFLLSKGARIDRRSRAGHTALFLAASRGHLESVDALIAAGASVSATAVREAETQGYKAITEHLRASRADRSTGQRRPARTPEE
ncbi:ankyrin repeat domain-containing protein [bacterium]|nr:ankyrin repeat domain-containing protein [bacterium]